LIGCLPAARWIPKQALIDAFEIPMHNSINCRKEFGSVGKVADGVRQRLRNILVLYLSPPEQGLKPPGTTLDQ
jgi:hypothetical protein